MDLFCPRKSTDSGMKIGTLFKTNQALFRSVKCKMATVLQHVSMPACIDVAELRRRVAPYMESRKEFYADTKRNLYVEDEFSEYWTAKATNGTISTTSATAATIRANTAELLKTTKTSVA